MSSERGGQGMSPYLLINLRRRIVIHRELCVEMHPLAAIVYLLLFPGNSISSNYNCCNKNWTIIRIVESRVVAYWRLGVDSLSVLKKIKANYPVGGNCALYSRLGNVDVFYGFPSGCRRTITACFAYSHSHRCECASPLNSISKRLRGMKPFLHCSCTGLSQRIVAFIKTLHDLDLVRVEL